MRRIAITAAGIVSPIGGGVHDFANQLLAGDSGVRRLADVFGAHYADVPVPYGAVVERAAVTADDGTPLHRSIAFARDALRQILECASDPSIHDAGLHCGVGLGQLALVQDDCRKFGSDAVLRDLELQLAGWPQQLALTSVRHADQGTLWLQQELGIAGPAATYNGACSAATQACIGACEDISAGATYAIGGGHDSLFSAAGMHLMYALGTLTEDQASRPFDLERDGTMIGEGAAYFLFEDLAHARARNAKILAEVTGWSSSLDGYHLTTPDPSGAPAIGMIERAMHQASLTADRIDYVQAHGTGTLVNDRVEANIIRAALGGHRAYVSSVKAQVGHWIAACGAVGLAACLAALERQHVPPNPNLRRPDPECDVELAPQSAVPARIENVLCNSFGFGGQNSCLVLHRVSSDAES